MYIAFDVLVHVALKYFKFSYFIFYEALPIAPSSSYISVIFPLKIRREEETCYKQNLSWAYPLNAVACDIEVPTGADWQLIGLKSATNVFRGQQKSAWLCSLHFSKNRRKRNRQIYFPTGQAKTTLFLFSLPRTSRAVDLCKRINVWIHCSDSQCVPNKTHCEDLGNTPGHTLL